MKHLFTFFLFLVSISTMNAQSVSLFNIDASSYPTMKAKFFAFDKANKQQRPSKSELTITENGQRRTITSVTCPPDTVKSLSVCIMVDTYGYGLIKLAQAGTQRLINYLHPPNDETAIIMMNQGVQIHQDFTFDTVKAAASAATIPPAPGYVDVQKMFYYPYTGGVPFISGRTSDKKVLILVSDLHCPNLNLDTARLYQDAAMNNISVYAVLLGTTDYSGLFTRVAAKTGGKVFEAVRTESQITNIFQEIERSEHNIPCDITWEGGPNCFAGTTVELSWQGQKTSEQYTIPATSIAAIKIKPSFINFGKRLPSSQNDTTLTLTAQNTDFTVMGIRHKIGTTAFSVVNTTFPITILKNTSTTITLRFAPGDSSKQYASFEIETDKCYSNFSAYGGYPGTTMTTSTLKLTRPNGGEQFVVGSDTLIEWDGIGKNDTVSLEYSIDAGNTWKPIVSNASTLQYAWKNVPKPASTKCKMRVKQNAVIDNENFGTILRTLGGHRAGVLAVAWSPDGSKVATGSYDKTAIIWDAISGKKLLTLQGHTSNVTSVAWSPDGTKIITGSADFKAFIWDASTGEKLMTLSGHSGPVSTVAWSPDGTKIVTGSDDHMAIVWDAQSGIKLIVKGFGSNVTSVAWSPDGTKVIAGSFYNRASIWDIVSDTEILTLGNSPIALTLVDWSPDGTKVITGNGDTAIIWDASNGAQLLRLNGHTNTLNSVAWSPDGSKIATGGYDTKTIIWDATSGANLLTLGSNSRVFSVAWSPDGTKVMSGRDDALTIIWDATSGAKLTTLVGYNEGVNTVAWNPEGTKVATVGNYNMCIIWDAISDIQPIQFFGHSGRITSAAWSPDGKNVITGSEDRTSIIWDMVSGTELQTLKGHTNYVNSVAWSPDGTKVATASLDKTTVIWDVVSGTKIVTLNGHTAGVNSVAWSPEGLRVSTGSTDGKTIIWDVMSWKELMTLNGHKAAVHSVAWSPDGTKIISGSWDNSSIIWDVENGTQLFTLKGHTSLVNSAAWSPYGTKVATGSSDNSVIIWNAENGTLIKNLKGHTGVVNSVAWSPDGAKIATGSGDHSAIIWDCNVPSLQEDVSDAVFSIIAPEPTLQNLSIDIGKVLVGQSKDSTVLGIICNKGLAPLHVLGIDITSGDFTDFTIPRGAGDFFLDSNKRCQDVMFGFAPTKVGLWVAKATIRTTVGNFIDTITITGEGIAPEIAIVNPFIDFGKTLVGTPKDSTKVVTIKNVGTADLTITQTDYNAFNTTNFLTITGGNSFILKPNEEAIMDLRFLPIDAGRTSGILQFHYNGVGSPATVQLFGEGLYPSTTVVAQDITAQAGEKVKLTLKLQKSSGMQLTGSPTDWQARIHYNKSILFNTQTSNVCAGTKDSCALELTGIYNPKTDELISIPCITTLGNTDHSTIVIDTFFWKNSAIVTEVATQNGTITLNGVCEDGGVRLFIPAKNSTSLSTRPNPAQDNLQIQYGLREPLTVTLELLTMTGQVVQTIINNQSQVAGQYTLTSDLSILGNGVYLLRLRTNKEMLTTRVDVVK